MPPLRVRVGRLAVLLVALASGAAGAQERRAPAPPFGRLTVADGLSQGTVWALHQDRWGFIWVGTSDGLNRFDGYEVTTYFAVPGDPGTLGGNYVEAIAEDGTGALWIATDGGGLARYSPHRDRFRRYRHSPSDPATLPSDEVLSLALDRAGRVWAGTADGLARLDPATGRVERFSGHPLGALRGGAVNAVLVTRAGDVWADAPDGRLVRYSARTGRLAAYAHRPGDAATPAAGPSYVFLEGSDGAIWVGRAGGLTRLDARSGAVRRWEVGPGGLPAPDVRGLAEDAAGDVWVGTYGGGLARVDGRTGAVVPVAASGAGGGPLPTDDLTHVLIDRAGNLWAGTVGHGVVYAAPPTGLFAAYRPTLEEPDAQIVRDFAEDADGRLWVATGAGVALADPNGGVYRPTPPGAGCLRAPYARTVAVDRRGRVWAGFYDDGLCVYEPSTGRSRRFRPVPGDAGSLPSATVYEVAVDAGGAVWAGTNAGLARYDEAAGRFRRVRLDPGGAPVQVYHVVAARGGGVWVGTGGRGVFRVGADGRVRRYGSDEGDPGTLDSPTVYALYEAPDGALWVGTGSGLNRLDPATGRAARFGAEHGLPPGAVNGVERDGAGRLWASTNRGLARLDAGAARFVVYDGEDGLPFSEFAFSAAGRLRSGALVFGGTRGFVAVRPGRLAAPRPAPPVVFTGIEVYGSAYRGPALWASGEVRLGPGEDGFAVTFAALDYAAPQKVRYAYRLEGRTDEWVETGGRRYASFAAVPPGTYTLRVRAANADGVWGEEGAALRVVRLPHWWQTAWARALALALVVGLAVAAYRWRVGQLLAVERARRRIADDLHDDLGGRLGALALQVELAGRDARVGPEARRRLEEAARAARAASAEVRDAIWAVDAGHGSAGALLDRMEAVAYEALRGVAHRVERPAGAPDVALDPGTGRDVLLAFREALHNAARHAGAARVEVRLVATPDAVGFEVRDDGRGFEPAPLAPTASGAAGGGRGLRTMRERAERAGGRLLVESAPGRGTAVRLEVPPVGRRDGRRGWNGVDAP